jgi:Ca2+-transporting ATPase
MESRTTTPVQFDPPLIQAHAMTREEAVSRAASDSDRGLGDSEAERRRARFGFNELPAARANSFLQILANQFKNVLILILFVALILSAALGHWLESTAIAAIALLSILLGFIQEFRAERALNALRQLAAPMATALRNGEPRKLPSRELVPGDVVLLAAGDVVPADGRLIDAQSLRVVEASLTGESSPVSKNLAPLPADTSLPDRKNMVYSGTAAVHGRGRAVVLATGGATEVGRIGSLLQSVEAVRTPLELQMKKLGRWLGAVAFGIVISVVALGLARGQPWIEIVLFGIALAVAAVPEALPAVATVSLALGARRMARKNALIRRLLVVETLGSATVICADKTGTLTTGEMTAREIAVEDRTVRLAGVGYDPHGEIQENDAPWRPDDAVLSLLRAAALCCDADLIPPGDEDRWRISGDPTEGALVVAAAKAGIDVRDLRRRWPRVSEIPFSSERKKMTTIHETGSERLACCKGAPEVVLQSCGRRRTASGDSPIGPADRESILARAEEMAARALRVLAVAEGADPDEANAEADLTFLGLIGIIDPPREEAKAAVITCLEAGIRPIMITGDHPSTAAAIARELGLLRSGGVLTGRELEAMSDADLVAAVGSTQVYARVSPAHKLRIVSTLQRRGHVVAMTGDGVNDAPALKKADVGIAMGITGTDVSKEAASITLIDDNFASIVAAVEEGRSILDNIKKFLLYLLSSNFGEIGLIAAAVAAGLPLPLTAVQILYVNLATDGLPALALAVDPHSADVMRRKPRKPGRSLLSWPASLLMLSGGVWSATVNLGVFLFGLSRTGDLSIATTMTFTSLVLIQFFKAYSFRSERRPIFEGLMSNSWLNLAVTWELMLLAAILFVPWLQRPFGTVSLTLFELLTVLAASLSVVPTLEAVKWLGRRGWLGSWD